MNPNKLTFIGNNKETSNNQYNLPQNLNYSVDSHRQGLPNNNNLNFKNNNNSNKINPFAFTNNNNKLVANKKIEENPNNNIENKPSFNGSQQITGNKEKINKIFESKPSFAGGPNKNKEIVEASNLDKSNNNSNDNNFNYSNKVNIPNHFNLQINKNKSYPQGSVNELFNPKKEVGERQDFSYNTRLGFNLRYLSYQNNRLE